MDVTLSVYFNLDKTYVLLIERSEKGLNLKYVNSTNNPVDLEMPDTDRSRLGIEEFHEIINDINGQFDRVAITLPAENAFITQFPAKENLDRDDMVDLVNLELSQVFPNSNMKEFSITVIPFAKDKKNKLKMMAVIISKQIIETCYSLFKPFGIEIDNMEISQLNAHSSYIYNYPETNTNTVVFVNVQDRFMDISLLKDKEPLYYSLAAYDSPANIGEIFEKEYNKMIENVVDEIKAAYFFGSGLNKEINMMCWETGMMLGIETKRLNPFRMMKSSVDQRTKDYCSRVFHLYPGPVGACIPPVHQREKLA